MAQLRLALVIHNHQPIGNFDGVFEQAFQDSYRPMLDMVREFPQIAITLHNSGSLLEWLVEKHPEYIDQIRQLVERGQVEVIGGPFYEPILACIPQRDRVGQMRQYGKYLEGLFGIPVKGMWVPERVWEQSFTKDIVDAGIEYTVLDDYHFRCAGLTNEELSSFFLTEDEGRLLKVFPVAERLRYTIPFEAPEKTFEFLRGVYEKNPNAVMTFGDDGEKFGTWPGTKEAVFEKGWLRTFFQMLTDNASWLKLSTLAECVENVLPAGRIYMPDSSYREMTEWVLPTERQKVYLGLRAKKQKEDADWPQLAEFLRGGAWRNFRTKYPESNEMYSRMLQVSRRLDELTQADRDREFADQLNEARTELYRGQCNCSYWHGAFGGLYLPHLRHAVYNHLIAADTLLEHVAKGLETGSNSNGSAQAARWVRLDCEDFDLDARKEVRLAGDRLVAFLAPSRGGHLYEFDLRGIRQNLLGTLNRRPEIYHEAIIAAAKGTTDGVNAASIQGGIRCKQADLDKKIVYDTYPRKALVDHFLQPDLSLEEFRAGRGFVGDFYNGVYHSLLRRSRERVEVCLLRKGTLASYKVQVAKTVALDVSRSGELAIRYELEELPAGLPIHFAVEFNFSGLPGGASDRYYYNAAGQRLGQLDAELSFEHCDRIGLVDEWLGVDVALDLSKSSKLWTFPIESVSQSEGGFETVHQACCVVPHWEFIAPEDGKWSVEIKLGVDCSAAQAKQLCKAGEGR